MVNRYVGGFQCRSRSGITTKGEIMNIKNFFYWCVAALALIALASPYPDMATLLVIILICGVVLTHASDYVSILQANTPSNVKKG